MQKPDKPARPGKLRVRISRVLLCLLGVFFLYMGTSLACNGNLPAYRVFTVILGIGGIAVGLRHLYVGIFGPDERVGRLLANLMESE
jgi:hypothetical protein